MTPLEKAEMLVALRMIESIVENDAAVAISFTWRDGHRPEIVYTPNASLEYVSVSFSVQTDLNEPKEHVLEAGQAVKQNAGGFLVNSEAEDCEECGGRGGHHSAGYGTIPRCSKLVEVSDERV